ncbi:hypothetical protein N0480_12035 [Pseudomonas aeruginosa]|nr:hypothetical protein [Pseudomonas aeruginosa]
MKQYISDVEPIHSENESVTRPPWLHPDSNIKTWYLPKKGKVLGAGDQRDRKNSLPLSFEYKFIDGSEATSPYRRLILNDIQSSCIALFESSTISRTDGYPHFIRTVFQIIDHTLECLIKSNEKPELITLSDITEAHVTSFLLAHCWQLRNLDIATLRTLLEETKGGHFETCDEVFENLDLPIITRKILKQKLKDQERAARSREYSHVIDLNEELPLSISSLKNKILHLIMLSKVREHQKFKFQLGERTLTQCLATALSETSFTSKIQTPLMPTSIAMHYISESIRFHRDYAPPLIEYIRALEENFKTKIQNNYSKKTIRSRIDEFRKRVFETTLIPLALQPLNIRTFGYAKWTRGAYEHHGVLRNHISTAELINIYTITTKILIHTFTACRTRSVDDLTSNCLTTSKLDGLWDIIITTPKIGNDNKLPQVKRPIPEAIWKFLKTYIDFIFDDTDGDLPLWKSRTRDEGTISYTTTNKYLDQFADWTEVPLIDGRRWYARPHEFRRFFAALYLYLDKDVDLEPLSWMMTHMDEATTFYYSDITSDPEWADETFEFIKCAVSNLIDKKVIIDDEIVGAVNSVKEKVKLGDPELIDLHIRKLISDHEVKIKIINNNQVLIYGTRR